MAGGCRDCQQCTEPAMTGMIMMIPRLAWWCLTAWNIGLFTKRCPQCKHLMSKHERRADGSLKD